MPETMAEQDIKGIWSFIILGIILVVIGLAAWILLPGIKEAIGNWFGWNKLDPELEKKTIANFDKLIENMNSCYDVDDELCICEVWPDFPAVFHKDARLEIDDNLGKVILFNKNELFRNGSTESEVYVYPFGFKEKLFYSREYDTDKETILFSKEFPFFNRAITTDNEIISKYFLKSDLNEVAVITMYTLYNKEEQDDSYKKDLIKKIDELPKCSKERKAAIEEYKKVLKTYNDLNFGEYKIQLPEDYRIKIENNKISLLYGSEIVKELTVEDTKWREFPGLPEKNVVFFQTKELSQEIKQCSNLEEPKEYVNNQLIIIKEEANIACFYNVI